MNGKSSHPFKERSNKYSHGERVATLGLRLRRLILPNENEYDDILTAAAWFHDVCNGPGVNKHGILGAERAGKLLAEYCTSEELKQICYIIAVHGDRKNETVTYSNALKIHQDADRLDHFGTYDIWSFVTYSIALERTTNDALHYLQNTWLNNFTKWRDDLHFDLSKKIFDEKKQFTESFAERFAVECAGGIWNEKALLEYD